MKTSNLIKMLCLLVIISMSSCNSDPEPSPDIAATLMGKWEFGTTVSNGIETDATPYAGCTRDYVEFKPDGQHLEIYHASDCSVTTFTENYTINNKTITVTNSAGSTFKQEIMTLNSKTLKVSTYEGSNVKTYHKVN